MPATSNRTSANTTRRDATGTGSTATKTAKKTAAKKTAAKKTAAKKTTATKTAAKKATAKKATAKKTAAKKIAAKKATAKKTAAKKTTAKKSTAKKSTGKKATAKKSATKKSGAKKPASGMKNPAKRGGKKGGDLAAAIATITANAAARGVELPPGASEEAIVAAEQELGFTLPAEVRAWYRAHDGGGERFVANNRELLSLERMVGEWKVWKDLLDQGVFEGNDHSVPGPGVQEKWWIPEWIPVTYDGAGNHDVIDLAPDTGGEVGQIVEFWHDEEGREVIAADLIEFLLDVEWSPSEF